MNKIASRIKEYNGGRKKCKIGNYPIQIRMRETSKAIYSQQQQVVSCLYKLQCRIFALHFLESKQVCNIGGWIGTPAIKEGTLGCGLEAASLRAVVSLTTLLL